MVSLATLKSIDRASSPAESEPARGDSVSRSAFWVLVARGWSVAASAALGILLPRWFGANVAACGEVLLLISLVGFAAMFASFGLPETMIRLVAARLAQQQPDAVRTLVLRCSQLLLWTTLITAAATAAYFWFDGFQRFQLPGSLLLSVVIGIAIIALAWQMVDAAVLRGLHEVKWANLLSGGHSGGPLAVTGFLLMLAGVFLLSPVVTVTSTFVAQLLMAAFLCTASITFWRLWKTLPTPTPTPTSSTSPIDSVPTVPELAFDALPIALSQFAAFCTLSADLWLAGAFLGTDDVAYYGSAKRLVLLLGVPEQLAMLTIIAIIPDLYARGRLIELQRVVRQATSLAAIPAILAAIVLIAVPQSVLGLAFGVQYKVAAGVLVVLTLGQLTANCLGPCGYVLLMTGRRWTVLVITLCCGLAAIGAGAVGAYYGGMLGLAIAAACCSAAQIVLEWLAARYYIGIWCHASPLLLSASWQQADVPNDSLPIATLPTDKDSPL